MVWMMTRRALMALAVLTPFLAQAQAQARPLLVVEGPAGETVLDEDAFAALPQHELTTHTAWTDGAHVFSGVLLRDVLAKAGYDQAALAGHNLRLLALNDYVISIGAEDAFTYDNLVARSMDGTALHRADKGPLWLVYPRDDHEELKDQRFDHRWAWQLAKIIVDRSE